ncbi:MAG: hypothetical protein G01um101417_177 [Parcubacteria group bacterium Gr01-1014_17]|nr:MAG: hypothetical protein G01um101417_177 [Parcubacteria group bacterium Gr01-1014_17]
MKGISFTVVPRSELPDHVLTTNEVVGELRKRGLNFSGGFHWTAPVNVREFVRTQLANGGAFRLIVFSHSTVCDTGKPVMHIYEYRNSVLGMWKTPYLGPDAIETSWLSFPNDEWQTKQHDTFFLIANRN